MNKNKKDGADKYKVYWWDCTQRYSTIALGATTFDVLKHNIYREYWLYTRRKISLIYFELKYDGLHYILSLYSKKPFSTIASGATPIGSAERAPNDISWQSIRVWKMKECYSHREQVLWLLKPEYFQSKFDCDMRFSSCVIATKLECRDLSRR
jgi:hypothetical protein